MAVKSGYRRLKEFDEVSAKFGWCEAARATLDIPENAVIINITDEFANGGPIVISSCVPTDEETREENRKNLQYAIGEALYGVVDRYESDPVFRKEFDEEVISIRNA